MINWTMIYGKDSTIECIQCGSRFTYRKESSFTKDYAAILWVCLKCGKNMPVVPAKDSGSEMVAVMRTFKDRYDRLLRENLLLFRQVLRLRSELKTRIPPLKKEGSGEGLFTREDPYGTGPMEAGIHFHQHDQGSRSRRIVD